MALDREWLWPGPSPEEAQRQLVEQAIRISDRLLAERELYRQVVAAADALSIAIYMREAPDYIAARRAEYVSLRTKLDQARGT